MGSLVPITGKLEKLIPRLGTDRTRKPLQPSVRFNAL